MVPVAGSMRLSTKSSVPSRAKSCSLDNAIRIGAGDFGAGALNGGACAEELRAQAIDFRLKRARVDLEEEVAASHDGAFGETDGGHIPRHARPDGHRIDGFEAAGELVPFSDVASD